MPFSKAAEPPGPKCTRCRHHGLVVPLKGHKKRCPYLSCSCWKCGLITERTRIATLQRHLRPNTGQRPAEGGTGSPSALAGGSQPVTSGLTPPPPGEAPGRAVANRPLDLRTRRPAAGGGNMAAVDGGVLPSAPSQSRAPLDTCRCVESLQTAPLPIVHVPFRMPGQFACSFVPYPKFLLNIPAGVYNSSVQGPQMLPCFHSDALNHPAPAQPGPFSQLPQPAPTETHD